MNNKQSVDWSLLLDQNKKAAKTISKWSNSSINTSEATKAFAKSSFSGEFRKLVKNNGTAYGRRLARKALKYRNVT